jgi:hypothetical protein
MRYLTILTAAAITLGGFILMFTPLPGAAFIFATGLTLLICTSEWFAERIRSLRTRVSQVDKAMAWLEDRMGARIGSALRRTRPEVE